MELDELFLDTFLAEEALDNTACRGHHPSLFFYGLGSMFCNRSHRNGHQDALSVRNARPSGSDDDDDDDDDELMRGKWC